MSEPQVKTRMESSSNILPPISALFQGGTQASSVALQTLISEIDLQLDVNTRELDTCLQSILTACNRLPGSRTFSTPKDALGYMCSSHTLEKDTCYDPEAEEAVAIIKALCDSLEKNPGSEESILQEILSLASEEGLILPLRCSSLAAISQSSSSLNMQLDTMDQLIEGKWGKLIHNIQKHLVSQLLNLPALGTDRNYFWMLSERRMELVGGLRALATDDEAWITYRNVRGQQLEQLFNSLLPDNDSENVNYKEFCGNCDTVASRIVEMMEEDFIVLSSGQFKKIGGVLRILHDLYLEKYSDEMSLLVEEIADDIRDFNKKALKASKSDHGINKIQGKPPHRGSLGGTPPSPPQSPNRESWVNKLPSNSKSLDTMFLASAYKTEKERSSGQRMQRQSSMAVPKDCLTSLRLIALSLLKLEEFLESLGRMTSWDVTGLPIRKNKKKSNLRGVLKPCASPELRRHSLNLGSSFSSSDTQLDTSTAGERNTGSPQLDSPPAPKVIERNRSEDRVRWDWRMIFKKIASGVASAVEAKIEYAMSSALSKETAVWEEKRLFKTADFDFPQYGGHTDRPPTISKDVEEFIASIHELLPLARAGLEGCLIPVRTAFIDSLRIAVKNFHLHCVSLSKDIPTKASLKQLLIVISNATYIKNYLHHVKTVLSADDHGKTFMSTLLKQYTELVDGLGKHLLQLHNQLISTVVLSDAESSNWANVKEFYEDERCSFSIQMWNFHLRGARHDMWQILPPKLAQAYFASVLQDSSMLLMQRYSRVKPSFRRVKQMRYDITAILLCTSAFLLNASPTPSQVLDPGHNEAPHYSLHNQASNLLASMAIVTSPIEILYREFKRGFHQHFETQGPETQAQAGNTQWLRWIWRALFSSGTKHYDDMQTASALYLHLQLMLAQPVIEKGLLIQALVMKDYTLAKILLSKACLQDDSVTNKLALAFRSKTHPQASTSERDSQPPLPSSSSSSKSKSLAAQKSQSSTDSSGSQATGNPSSPKMADPKGEPTAVQKVSNAVMHIMAHLQYFPDALVKCVIPTIERSGCFEMFNVKNPLFSPDLEIPEWLVSLFSLMEPFTERTIEPMLRYVNKVKISDTFNQPVISFVADLPCGCPPNYSLRDHPKPPTMKEVLIHCVELIISEIEKSIIVLPVSVLAFFGSLEASCYEQGIKTSHRCVALQIIAWGLWYHLHQLHVSKDFPSDLVKLQLKEHLPNLAENLFYILTYGKGPNTPRFASKFIKSHKDWLHHKFQNISMFVSNDIHSMPDMDVTEMATNAFSDHLYSMIASNLMESPNGTSNLSVVSNLIVNNGPWLKTQMNIQGPLADKGAQSKKHVFMLDISPATSRCNVTFDPMKEINHIGDETFNQNAIMEFPLDWVAILSSDLGLSRAAFRSLLLNRSEMQEGAELEDNEKKPVDVLRAVYEHG